MTHNNEDDESARDAVYTTASASNLRHESLALYLTLPNYDDKATVASCALSRIDALITGAWTTVASMRLVRRLVSWLAQSCLLPTPSNQEYMRSTVVVSCLVLCISF